MIILRVGKIVTDSKGTANAARAGEKACIRLRTSGVGMLIGSGHGPHCRFASREECADWKAIWLAPAIFALAYFDLFAAHF